MNTAIDTTKLRRSLLLGHSHFGRPIRATMVGAPQASRRALVVAGQHGDEPLAMEAVAALMQAWPAPDGVCVTFVPCLNPDGLGAQTRTNGQNIDLNRDHQRLRTPECRALHRFARAFAPQLVIDVHTFKPRRRTLRAHGLEWGADVMVELDNHPARLAEYAARWQRWLGPVVDALTADNIPCERYLLVRPSGRIRTSSADVVDARNGLAARMGATGVLVEGREPSRLHGSPDKTRAGLWRAVESILRQAPVESAPAPTRLHVDAQRVPGPGSVSAYTIAPGDRAPRRRPLPGRPFVELRPTQRLAIPDAYGVPHDAAEVVELLRRHGFASSSTTAALAEEHVGYVDGGKRARRPDRALRNPSVRWVPRPVRDQDRTWFFTSQPHGHWLAALLEPTSRYGLHRYGDLEIPLVTGQPYAISRGHFEPRKGSA